MKIAIYLLQPKSFILSPKKNIKSTFLDALFPLDCNLSILSAVILNSAGKREQFFFNYFVNSNFNYLVKFILKIRII